MKKFLYILCTMILIACVLVSCCAQPVPGPQGEKGEKGDAGLQGISGEDGITPQIRINSDTNLWEVSVDAGKTWKTTGVKAVGSKGATGASIKKIEFDEQGDIVITLTDGTVLPAVEIPERHTYGEWELYNCTEKTSCENRVYYRTCSECDTMELRHGKEGDHDWSGPMCKKCTKTLYVRENNQIYFGMYPQSEVTDPEIVSRLNSKSGGVPSKDEVGEWTSYGYYDCDKPQDYMWFIDVNDGDSKYRGVYFTSYRPFWNYLTVSADNSMQDDNGYTTGVVYWFKYDPIAWTIVEEDDDSALLICNMIIDSQAYQNEYEHDEDKDETVVSVEGVASDIRANNYAYSTIRAWLNDIFYNTAFSDLQQQLILNTTVSNDVESTGYSSNPYTCEDTKDKIFLLSAEEALREDYGFTTTIFVTQTRNKVVTSYAKVQGTTGEWWLRSPASVKDGGVRVVGKTGSMSMYSRIWNSSEGIVPVLRISLN